MYTDNDTDFKKSMFLAKQVKELLERNAQLKQQKGAHYGRLSTTDTRISPSF